eukprot:2129554-Rhodomonas_salina.2
MPSSQPPCVSSRNTAYGASECEPQDSDTDAPAPDGGMTSRSPPSSPGPRPSPQCASAAVSDRSSSLARAEP